MGMIKPRCGVKGEWEWESQRRTVVSAAAGGVGQIVGQIGKIKGCRVIGIAGGPEKCAFVVDELGFDAAIDYRSEDVGARLDALVSAAQASSNAAGCTRTHAVRISSPSPSSCSGRQMIVTGATRPRGYALGAYSRVSHTRAPAV